MHQIRKGNCFFKLTSFYQTLYQRHPIKTTRYFCLSEATSNRLTSIWSTPKDTTKQLGYKKEGVVTSVLRNLILPNRSSIKWIPWSLCNKQQDGKGDIEDDNSKPARIGKLDSMLEWRIYLSKKEKMKKVDESSKKVWPLQQTTRIQLLLKENWITPSSRKWLGSWLMTEWCESVNCTRRRQKLPIPLMRIESSDS